jgi:hypothetical protein
MEKEKPLVMRGLFFGTKFSDGFSD